LGAPLSIDWGSVYSPRVAGAYMHSSVLPENAIGQSWNADSPTLDDVNPSPWANPNQTAFANFTASAQAAASFTAGDGSTWLRSITSINANPNFPVISIVDTFQGKQAASGKVFTLNLMAQGGVQTPSGSYTPSTRFYDGLNGTSNQLPSAGPVMSLGTGPNKFSFSGQWLIDWDLYSITAQPQQALIGNWGHDWHPDTEMDQFQNANGRQFSETQHILRIRGTDAFRVLLLPYRKGQQRSGVTVSNNGVQSTISASGETTTVGDQLYAYQSATQTILSTFGSQSATAYGIQISGGPAEVVISGGRVKITAHGAPGPRQIVLPGSWTVVSPITFSNGVYTFNYPGGGPVTVTM